MIAALLYSLLLNCNLIQTGKIQVQFNPIDTIVIAIAEVLRPTLVRVEKMIAEDIVKKLETNPKWLLAQWKSQSITTIITIIGISIDPEKNRHPNLAINSILNKYSSLNFCVILLMDVCTLIKAVWLMLW